MKKNIFAAIKEVKDELDHSRKKILFLNAERRRVKGLSVSLEERSDALYREINSHADLGRERFFNLANVAELSTHNSQILLDLFGDTSVNTRHLVEFLCCAFGPQLKENLSRELKAVWPSDAIGAAERKEKLQQIEEELHQLEVTEERIVCELEGLGIEVEERRPNVTPSVFLEVQ